MIAPLAALLGSTVIALIAAAIAGAFFVRVGSAWSVIALLLGILALWILAVRVLLTRYVLGPLAYGREATRALVRANKLAATGQLAAGIAHEVGNPLSAIANYAHLVRQRSGDSDALRDPLEGIEREVERIDRIVRGLLDFARPRRHTPRAVNVDEVMKETLQLLADQGLLRRIEVKRTSEADDADVFAERQDLEQVFVNLVLNAVDAMEGVGTLSAHTRRLPAEVMRAVAERRRADDDPTERFPHEPNVRARAWLARRELPEAVLQVVVADSGPGVPPEDLDRIFDPFYSTKGEGRGTGLGLAIVAQTIEGLGGTIWAQPAREGGAAFVILLPIRTAVSG